MADMRMLLLLRKKLLLQKRRLQGNILLTSTYLFHKLRNRRLSRKRRWWVRPAWRNRETEGEFHMVMKCLRNQDVDYFKKRYRMTPSRFVHLSDLLRKSLTKKRRSREPLSSDLQLALTLRYLISGMAIQDIALAFRMGISTAATAIHKTCRVVWSVLQPLYMKNPSVEDYERIASEFGSNWQFPNCMGAIGGKHVEIHNYKGHVSLVAASDSQYRFIAVDVVECGDPSDGNVFKQCSLGQSLEKGSAPLPNTVLPCSTHTTPHVFVGDEAFHLEMNLMRPYSGHNLDTKKRVFNYRLNRARRCVENALGILSTRWKIFRRPINTKATNVDAIIKATCVMHNYLCIEEASRPEVVKFYCPSRYADIEDSGGNVTGGLWREELDMDPANAFVDLPSCSEHNYTRKSSDIRETFAKYFVSRAGLLSWQLEKI